MSVERVTYADSRVSIDGNLLIGVTSCDLNAAREVENIRGYTRIVNADRVLKSDQKPTAKISWILGNTTIDPFFDIQTDGILSVEQFDIVKQDAKGTTTVSGGFLTSYSIKGSVGELVSGDIEYEGTGYSAVSSGATNGETNDSLTPFLASNISVSGGVLDSSFSIQGFEINLPIPRKTLKIVGEMVPTQRIPQLPVEATVRISILKNQAVGIDYSEIILGKTTLSFALSDPCSATTVTYTIQNCSLISVSESVSLDGEGSIELNYVASVIDGSLQKT